MQIEAPAQAKATAQFQAPVIFFAFFFQRQSHNSWGEKILLTGSRGQSPPLYPANTGEESCRAKATGTDEPRATASRSAVCSPPS